jgi:Family of unknown function (DUF6221)
MRVAVRGTSPYPSVPLLPEPGTGRNRNGCTELPPAGGTGSTALDSQQSGGLVEAENRATPAQPRRTGQDPAARRSTDVPAARASAETLVARGAVERALGGRPGTRVPPGQRRLAPTRAPWPVMWAVRHFLAERTAEVRGAADAGVRAGECGDPGRVLANCEAATRVVEAWDAVTVWADDPDAECPEAYQVASQGLFAAMWRLALRYADHPDFDPTWVPERSPRAV